MILVVCLNPALDVTHQVERVDWAGVNRPTAVYTRPGGKGVNVARTLHALGAGVVLLGLAGGPTGTVIDAELRARGLATAFTPIAGDTRRTFTVVDGSGTAALFSEPGPEVSAAEWAGFRAQYAGVLAAAARPGSTAVVLSGSLPPGLPADAYATLVAAAKAAGVPTLLDTSGAALRQGVTAGPDLVKPNLDELAALMPGEVKDTGGPGTPAGAQTSAMLAAAAIRAAGRTSVVVSLGAEGLLADTPAGRWHARPSAAVAGNATGAGDAVVAALAHGLVLDRPWPERLRHAVALGAATVASPVAGEFLATHYAAGVETTAVRELPPAPWPARHQEPLTSRHDQEAG